MLLNCQVQFLYILVRLMVSSIICLEIDILVWMPVLKHETVKNLSIINTGAKCIDIMAFLHYLMTSDRVVDFFLETSFVPKDVDIPSMVVEKQVETFGFIYKILDTMI